MLLDETIEHPMTFFLRADLVGQVHVANLGVADLTRVRLRHTCDFDFFVVRV